MQTKLFNNLAGDLTGAPDRRPPLVLLHGLTFDRTMWQPALAHLAALDPGRQVLALDLPGHGDSPGWPCYDLEPIADAVHQAVTEAGLSSPVLAGHSAGGVLVTIYASRYPARGVVNVDQPLQVEPFAQLLRPLAGPLRGPGFAQVWEQFEASMGIGLLPQAAQDLLVPAGRSGPDGGAQVSGGFRGGRGDPLDGRSQGTGDVNAGPFGLKGG
jgi:pimeloyl-ACP methyl ester carboxylesterase